MARGEPPEPTSALAITATVLSARTATEPEGLAFVSPEGRLIAVFNARRRCLCIV